MKIKELKKGKRWWVYSDTDSNRFEVFARTDGTFSCDCATYLWESDKCKHIEAVREYKSTPDEILNDIIQKVKSKIPKSFSTNEYYHPLVAPNREHIRTIFVKTGWLTRKKIALMSLDVEITGNSKILDLPTLIIYDKEYYNILSKIAKKYNFKQILKNYDYGGKNGKKKNKGI